MAYTSQPGKVQVVSGEFRHGLFTCCDSLPDCLLAYLCPNCYACIAAREAGSGIFCSVLNAIFYPLLLCCVRGNAREQRGIEGGCIKDLLATQCCPCCAAIQIKREFHD